MPRKKKEEKEAGPVTHGLAGMPQRIIDLMTTTEMLPVENFIPVDRLSTGMIGLDFVLGGGIPLGHVTTFLGDTNVGKTTSLLLAAKHISDQGMHVAYFDTENGAAPDWVMRIGCNPKYFHLIQPTVGEDMLNLIVEMCRVMAEAEPGEPEYEEGIRLIIIDSVPGTAFSLELEQETSGNAFMGVAARRWSAFRRAITPYLRRSRTALVLVNQLTFSMKFASNSPTVEYGGQALKYMATIRLRFYAPDRSVKDVVDFQFQTIRNRTAGLRQFMTRVNTGGDDVFVPNIHEMVKLAKDYQVFTKEDGSPIEGTCTWFFQGEQLGVGVNKATAAITLEPLLYLRVMNAVEEVIRTPKISNVDPKKAKGDDGSADSGEPD